MRSVAWSGLFNFVVALFDFVVVVFVCYLLKYVIHKNVFVFYSYNVVHIYHLFVLVNMHYC